jgi:catechol 2,3-dioxygenase-like lactoylglutathione lyase family enzyme
MPITARITVVTIGAHDLPKLRAFYRGLGWPERHTSTDGFASFYLDGAILALFPFEELAKDGHVPPSDIGAAFRGMTLAINVETAALVDSTIDELRAKDITITKEPQEEVWGGRSAYFADPEGNLWEVVYAPDNLRRRRQLHLGSHPVGACRSTPVVG